MSYDEIINALVSGFGQFGWQDALDIFIIFVLLYKLIIWTKQTRAYGVLKGIGVLFLCSVASQLFQLNTLSWVLDAFLTSGSILIVIVVLFQPEMRRVLERIGRSSKSIGSVLFEANTLGSVEMIRDVQRAILSMARRRVGALIVVEQNTGLGDIVNTGTTLDAALSGALLENIFEPNTPLHDGAVVVRGTRIAAAGCFLPLSDDMSLARELGTRHRAALGVSTVSDSVTIVVSEESGAISVARDGKLIRYIDAKALHDLLEQLFLQKTNSPFQWAKRRDRNETA